MSSDDVVIRVQGLSKCYPIYRQASDRLKQFIWPRLQRALGQPPRQYFREFWSLREVNFEVHRGETVGIIGRNGSGKSTLLQIICGTLHPTRGQVQIQGRVAALLELGSGFNPEFTGRENVFLNAGVLGLSRSQTEERLQAIEAFADIGQFIDQPVKTYSSGMLVRLAFAVVAHVDADILVIDEALAVGDAFFTQKCMRFLRQFMQTGTILFVSHDTAAVAGLCNRAFWLDQGQVMQQGSPKSVTEAYLQAQYEAQQGQSAAPPLPLAAVEPTTAPVAVRDQRQDVFNASNLRNDIEVFAFDPGAESFGVGGASITGVRLLDAQGQALAWVVGGEPVCLEMTALCHQALAAPILGFLVKDKLGQNLFGDSTFVTYMGHPQASPEGHRLVARFHFEMPRLPPGDYAVTAAVADGTQRDHVSHHWVHDALVFRSTSTSVASGLIGIPMRQIELQVLPLA